MILVTGGTGFVGREVVKELRRLGYVVRVLVRDPARASHLLPREGVEIVPGDVLKPETLPAAMAGVEAVIHLVGIIAETAHVTFEQAHVEATRHMLDAAQQAGVTRWIQMSALGTRPHAVSRYHITKWQAEELVRGSGLDWTIFRPSLIYGHDERDRVLNLLRCAVKLPFLPLLDGGEPRVQPVNVREVAHCFAHAIAADESVRQEFDLVGPEPLAWRELVFKVAKSRGRKAVYEDVPILVALRKLLWLAIALLPVAVIVGVASGNLTVPGTASAAAVEIVLILIASHWRSLILFYVPAGQVQLMAMAWDAAMPRGLRCGEQLKLAVEDNVGDPRPATRVFGYVPETIEVGLKRLQG